jgi:hypothetical protein
MSYQIPTTDHRISLATAIEMTTRYRENRQSILADPTDETMLPLSETFNKDAISGLLNTTGAEAFRIYYGMTENKNIHAILVAVDQGGNDILPSTAAENISDDDDEVILEDGQRCPYTCPPDSPLNG